MVRELTTKQLFSDAATCLWRGSLHRLECEAVVKSNGSAQLTKRWGRFAARREQVPSPQVFAQVFLQPDQLNSSSSIISAEKPVLEPFQEKFQ
jgi:hypothetical protein